MHIKKLRDSAPGWGPVVCGENTKRKVVNERFSIAVFNTELSGKIVKKR